MATIDQHRRARRRQAHAVRVPRRRRGRRDAQRRARRDGRQARPLPGAWPAPAPLTPAELADRTGTAERYVREWLNAQAAGGYVEYDPDSGRYTLPPEQAVALTDETARPTCPGFFQIALGSVHRLAAHHRGRPQRRRASAGTSTTTTSTRAASASSGPATTRTSSPSGCPRSTASSTSSQRGARGRRRRLRPRRLDDPDGAGVPALDVRRLRLPRRARSRPRASARGEAGVADRVRFEVAAATAYPRRGLRPRDDVRLPARHGRPGRRRPPRARVAGAATARG